MIIKKALQDIENYKSSDFNYKKYCKLCPIYAQVFLKENEFCLIQRENKKSIFLLLESVHKKLLSIIKNQILFKSESSLLEALMVGFTDDLDPGLLKSYADIGVMHIIAISGLHLALICHIQQLSLKRVSKNKSAHWIKLFLILNTL